MFDGCAPEVGAAVNHQLQTGKSFMKVSIENHVSLFLARPADAETRSHLEANVSDEAQWYGGALVIEPRYVENFILAFEDNGGEVAV